MRLSYAIRGALTALTVTAAALATAAYADSGSIRFNVVKAGFVVGASAGGGTLLFHGRRYPLSIGGISYGFTFGASATDFVGTVSNIRRPSDVNGIYGAAGAGAAIGRGAGGIVKRRGAYSVGTAVRTDRCRRPQRPSDHAAVASLKRIG